MRPAHSSPALASYHSSPTFCLTTVQRPLRSDFLQDLHILFLPRAAMLIRLGNVSASSPGPQKSLMILEKIPSGSSTPTAKPFPALLRLCSQDLNFFQVSSMNSSFSYLGTSHRVCLLCPETATAPTPRTHTHFTYSSFIFQLECNFLRARHSHPPHMCSSNSVLPS